MTPFYLGVAVLSWLLPGAGHVLLGYRVRGLVIGGALLGSFWLGETILANNMAVTREVHPIFFALQMGNGGSALLANELWGKPLDDEGNIAAINRNLPKSINLGILFCTISGLLNFLVVLHVLDPQTWREAEADSARMSVSDGTPQSDANEAEREVEAP